MESQPGETNLGKSIPRHKQGTTGMIPSQANDLYEADQQLAPSAGSSDNYNTQQDFR